MQHTTPVIACSYSLSVSSQQNHINHSNKTFNFDFILIKTHLSQDNSKWKFNIQLLRTSKTPQHDSC